MADFSDIGLSPNESKTFLALIRTGKASAGTVCKESGVPYSHIYDILGSLEHKGFVKVIPEKGKKFVPSDPQTIREIIRQKQEHLQKLDSEVAELKQLYEITSRNPVEIATGKKNFYKIEKNLPEPHERRYNIKFTAEFQPVWTRKYKEQMKQGIEIRDLVKYDSQTKANVNKWLEVNKNIRKIPNEGVAISIRDDKAIMIALINSNMEILVRDKAFVNLMAELFSSYYDHAEQINR